MMFVEEALQGEKCNSWESNSGQIEDNDILCLPTTGAFFKKNRDDLVVETVGRIFYENGGKTRPEMVFKQYF